MWNRKKKCKVDPETGKRIYHYKTPLQKLEEKADDLTREIVRLIYDWKCQKCGKTITNKSDAQPAHIVGRSQKLLRWDLLNLLLLCLACHRKYHDSDSLKDYVEARWPARFNYLYLWPNEDQPPRYHQYLPYRTLKEKEEWMEKIIAELEAKLKELKGK